MKETFEQGWAARPFKEQFPELNDVTAAWLDKLNRSITELYIGGLLTDSQVQNIRFKKMPKLVAEALRTARAAIAKAGGE